MSKSAGLRFPVGESTTCNTALRARFVVEHGCDYMDLVNRFHASRERLEILSGVQFEKRSFFGIFWYFFLWIWPLWLSLLIALAFTRLFFESLSDAGKSEIFVVVYLLVTVVVLGIQNKLQRKSVRERQEAHAEARREHGHLFEDVSPALTFAKDLAVLRESLGPKSDIMTLMELAVECQKKLENQRRGIASLWRDSPRSFIDGDGQRFLVEFFRNLDTYKRLRISITEPKIFV